MQKKVFKEVKWNLNTIKNVLNIHCIKGNISKISHLPFKKILIKIKDKKYYYLYKISYDPYSIKLSDNEIQSYKIIKNNKLNFIKIPVYKKITLNKKYSITKVKYINEKKGNFFEFDSFYKFMNLNKTKYSLITNYINLKMDNYIHLNKKIAKDLFINKYKIKIINKFRLNKVITNYSHGDFSKYNTLKNKKDNYVIDLEFFNRNRNFLYDYLFWHLVPVFNYLYKLNNIVHISILFYLTKNFIKYNLLKKKLYIDNLKLYFALFFFERILQLKTELKLKNIDQLLTKFHQRRNLKLINFYEKLLNYCLNKM